MSKTIHRIKHNIIAL